MEKMEKTEKTHSSFSDMVFEFIYEESSEVFVSSGESEMFEEEEEGNENSENVEERRSFWEAQNQILEGILRRSSSVETKIRNAAKEAVKEIQGNGGGCGCGKELQIMGCRSCLMREVSVRLRNAGYDSAVCKTKWRSSHQIPSGEHNFVDVVHSSKKGEMRFIIEPNFRGEFEMARAGEEYDRLVRQLPEVFIGKPEKLEGVIKVVCGGAKKCMKEKKMHLGPWRKQKYMHAKWLNACERTMLTPLVSVGYSSSRLLKPRASMLTVDLLDKLPNRTAVEVL